MQSREERFKSLLQRLDPKAPLNTANLSTLYADRPDHASRVLATAIELEPSEAYLLTGSIGCGKSTELVAIENALGAHQRIVTCRVEPAADLDLTEANRSTLVIAVLLEVAVSIQGDLVREFGAELAEAQVAFEEVVAELKNWAHSPVTAHEWHAPQMTSPDRLLVPRRLDWTPEVVEACIQIARRISGLFNDDTQLVVLVDGLDRIHAVQRFDELTEDLLHVLEKVGIGLVIVAPRKVLAGASILAISGRFAETLVVGPVEPVGDGLRFLTDVLARRDADALISPESRVRIAEQSGGAVRHLVELARAAVRQAYAEGASEVEAHHVDRACVRLGQQLLYGLTPADIRTLQSLLEHGQFAGREDEDLALVRSNRVLEYQRLAERKVPLYRVHPCLVPFLPALAAQVRRSPDGSDDIPF